MGVQRHALSRSRAGHSRPAACPAGHPQQGLHLDTQGTFFPPAAPLDHDHLSTAHRYSTRAHRPARMCVHTHTQACMRVHTHTPTEETADCSSPQGRGEDAEGPGHYMLGDRPLPGNQARLRSVTYNSHSSSGPLGLACRLEEETGTARCALALPSLASQGFQDTPACCSPRSERPP